MVKNNTQHIDAIINQIKVLIPGCDAKLVEDTSRHGDFRIEVSYRGHNKAIYDKIELLEKTARADDWNLYYGNSSAGIGTNYSIHTTLQTTDLPKLIHMIQVISVEWQVQLPIAAQSVARPQASQARQATMADVERIKTCIGNGFPTYAVDYANDAMGPRFELKQRGQIFGSVSWADAYQWEHQKLPANHLRVYWNAVQLPRSQPADSVEEPKIEWQTDQTGWPLRIQNFLRQSYMPVLGGAVEAIQVYTGICNGAGCYVVTVPCTLSRDSLLTIGLDKADKEKIHRYRSERGEQYDVLVLPLGMNSVGEKLQKLSLGQGQQQGMLPRGS